MLKSMNRYVWVAVSTVLMFVFSPKRSQNPLEAAVIAVAGGIVVLLAVLVVDFVVRPVSDRLARKLRESKRKKYPQLLLAAADGNTTRLAELASRQANVDEIGPNGETALMLAARNGRIDAVNFLLARGADRTIVTPKGSTAASLAQRYKHGEVTRLLSS